MLSPTRKQNTMSNNNLRRASRRTRTFRLSTVVWVALSLVFAGCAIEDAASPADGQVTVPPTEPTPPLPAGAVTTVAVRETVALEQSWFGLPKDRAIVSIERLGIYVADFLVCSGSVEDGEVRQITTGDGVILDDKDGLTDAAGHIEYGSVVQMKVGNGTPCD